MSHLAPQYNSALNGILLKLNLLLDQESASLEAPDTKALSEFAKKKINLFSELRMLNKRFNGVSLSETNESEMRRLQEKLSENVQKLNLRISAIRELNTVIEQAFLNDQSDGTYSIGGMAMRGYV